jgi:hypothetical protein
MRYFWLPVLLSLLFACQYSKTPPPESETGFQVKDYFPLDEIDWITFWDCTTGDTIQWQKSDTATSYNSQTISFVGKGQLEDHLAEVVWANDQYGIRMFKTQGRYSFKPPIQIAWPYTQPNTTIEQQCLRIDDEFQTKRAYYVCSTFLGIENLETAAGLCRECLKIRLEFFPWDNPLEESSYTFWFAKGLGLVKKDKSFQQLEIKQISLNGRLIPEIPQQKPRQHPRKGFNPATFALN